MRNYSSIGVQVADILLPKEGINSQKWASIACDQFTSQPEYWQKVAQTASNSPSTFHLILPEVYLGTSEEQSRIDSTRGWMRSYLEEGILTQHTGLIHVQRTSLGKTRCGLMLALDLENYDFNKGSQTLIRATEGTILDRLPPRMRIRSGAPLEIPHILVLIDDPENTVIAPVTDRIADLPCLYDFDLMLDSGHRCGHLVNDLTLESQVITALENLASPEVFYPKYGVTQEKDILLFAVGDGNHSLATAKSIWENIKPTVGMNHPARYALVEIENVHDQGLEFEPIHRVVFNLHADPKIALQNYFGENIRFERSKGFDQLLDLVSSQSGEEHVIGMVSQDGYWLIKVKNPSSNLPVGTLQSFLDPWIKAGNAHSIDYVHGAEVVDQLGKLPGNCGFFLPAMNKADLFRTVILDGALPRKTFSMGEASEKRFYMEARKIVLA